MAESVQSTGRSLKETLILVGSSEAFTKRVFLWTIPIGLFVAVFYDGNRFGTSRWGWLVAGLVAHAVATILMFILRQIFLPKGPYDSAVLRTLAIFIIGMFVYNLFFKSDVGSIASELPASTIGEELLIMNY